MSAQENSNPATVEKKYDITEKNDGCKHRPCKYSVPSSFVNPGVKANELKIGTELRIDQL